MLKILRNLKAGIGWPKKVFNMKYKKCLKNLENPWKITEIDKN